MVSRIDKISLLTPRAELAASVTVAGTTYLNVSATQLGGPTTSANVTISSATVYDEYLDLAGTASYNGSCRKILCLLALAIVYCWFRQRFR